MTVEGQYKRDLNKTLAASRHTGKAFPMQPKPSSAILQKTESFKMLDKIWRPKLPRQNTL
jgi:hypothetical protein